MNILSIQSHVAYRPCRQCRRRVSAAAAGRGGLADPHRAVLQSHRLRQLEGPRVRRRHDPRGGGRHRGSAACWANATACCRAIWARPISAPPFSTRSPTVKRANPAARYCCDPVIGDVGRGIFVREGIPEFMQDEGGAGGRYHYAQSVRAGLSQQARERHVARRRATRSRPCTISGRARSWSPRCTPTRRRTDCDRPAGVGRERLLSRCARRNCR